MFNGYGIFRDRREYRKALQEFEFLELQLTWFGGDEERHDFLEKKFLQYEKKIFENMFLEVFGYTVEEIKKFIDEYTDGYKEALDAEDQEIEDGK